MKHVRTIITLLLFALLPTKRTVAQDPLGTIRTVAIDPGHGGKDSGAPGAYSKEKNIVLDIALRLGAQIEAKCSDVKVVYTRKKDKFVELSERGNIANKANANLFISIHTNASVKKFPTGAETYVMGNGKTEANMAVAKLENSVIVLEDDYTERYAGFDNSTESNIYASLMQKANLDQSISFASQVQEQFKSINRMDRGVQQANFVVLWKTAMPSVLIEVGFISNAEEEDFLNTREGRDELASAICKAFIEYKAKVDARAAAVAEMQGDIPIDSLPTSPSVAEQPAAAPERKPVAKPQRPTKIEFAIQIATSAKPMDVKSTYFKNASNVERIQSSPQFYKYITARCKRLADAQSHLKKTRQIFKDAFVVGMLDGKIVPASDAVNASKQ